jgi:RNA polymerase sigma-70 factor (ECF subfamily)
MKDLDLELYNKYMNGEKNAFETLYNKYKNKIQYFIFNIVKNYEKAEDITQEVFIYILQNKVRENCSFKYYIYLVARSRAYNYINQEKRRTEINERYSLLDSEEIQKDVSDFIEKQEREKELTEAINMLDDKYKNAIYLTKIEGLSYKETAEILRTNH